MDTMGTSDVREQINRHYGYHQEQWSLQTPVNQTPVTSDTTRHPMNNMGSEDDRDQYTRHYGH